MPGKGDIMALFFFKIKQILVKKIDF